MDGDTQEKFCPRCGHTLAERLIHQKQRKFCPRCGYVLYRDPKLVVAVIVAEEGKVLMSRRNHDPGYGLWSFPSGFVDAGETVEEAAVREAKEETSLDVRLDRLLGIYSENGKQTVLIVYVGNIIGGQPSPGEEVIELGFFDTDNLPELAFDHDQQILRDWKNAEYGAGTD